MSTFRRDQTVQDRLGIGNRNVETTEPIPVCTKNHTSHEHTKPTRDSSDPITDHYQPLMTTTNHYTNSSKYTVNRTGEPIHAHQQAQRNEQNISKRGTPDQHANTLNQRNASAFQINASQHTNASIQ